MLSIFQDLPKFYSSGIMNSTIVTVLLVWSIFWKGLALWRAANNKQKYWFIAILILSTIGILEIIYLSYFQKPHKSK